MVTVNEVLTKIEDSGFEAYIVGGYVRDLILGIESTDVDICTNARVKELLDIFADTSATSNEYGSVRINSNNYRIDITTYRKDLKYNGDRKKVEIEYVDNLLEDINRRDFTMNTLCMNKEGFIVDILDGRKDIEDHIIRCVGKIDERLEEDPLRMLRAVRFACVLDFKIEEELYKTLKKKRKLIEKLSMERIKEELTKILVNSNCIKGLKLLRDLNYLEYMGISVPEKVVPVADICGMYSQLEFTKEYPFSKEERNSIKDIKKILNYGKIDNNVIFDYGLYISMVAGDILGIDKEEITLMDKDLPIRRYKDLAITTKEICGVLGIEPNKILNDVMEEIKIKVLDGDLENTNEQIKKYLFNSRKKWLNEGASNKDT